MTELILRRLKKTSISSDIELKSFNSKNKNKLYLNIDCDCGAGGDCNAIADNIN